MPSKCLDNRAAQIKKRTNSDNAKKKQTYSVNLRPGHHGLVPPYVACKAERNAGALQS